MKSHIILSSLGLSAPDVPTLFPPASGSPTGSSNGLHTKSNLLAINNNHMKIHAKLAALAIMFVIHAPVLRAQVPQLMNYQGRIAVGGVNFNGSGQFKFALVNATGTTSFWSNNNSSVAGGEPTAAVSLTVAGGLYTVLLGDATVPNMQAIPTSVFTNSDVRLRIWFNNGTNGFQLLTPDQRIAAVGYAVMSANVQDGAVTSAKIATGAVTSTKIASSAVGSSQIAAGAVGSGQITAGAIGASQLAGNSVLTGSIVNGSLLGDDFAANTLTGTQISDFLELGSPTVDGTLRLWDAGTDLQTIQLDGGSSSITTLGSDGLTQTQLSGSSFGILSLYDAATENNRTVFLAGHETIGEPPLSLPRSGGALKLFNAAGEGVYLKASTGGGNLTLRRSDGVAGVFVAGESTESGGTVSVRDTDGTETVEILGAGSAGTGGVVRINNATGTNFFDLYEDSAEGGGEIRIRGSTGGTKIHIEAQESLTQGGAIGLTDAAGAETISLNADDANETGGKIRVKNASGLTRIFLEASEAGTDGGQIALSNAAGTQTLILDAEFNNGGPSRLTTGTVEITGGSDLSEQFNISPAIGEAAPRPGMIVCIDPARPGELRTSSSPHDKTVAGIISGAGGVRPGMLMGQRDSLADGAYPVALSGRVYCYVDAAANGPIAPGDLITTSATPGHGMKVTDHESARGAVIGKAMTGLAEGSGLVLVLVTLQ